MLLSIYNPSFLGELNLHDVGVDLKWEELKYTVGYQVCKLNLSVGVNKDISVGSIKFFCGSQTKSFCCAHLAWFEDPLGKGGLVQKVWEVLKGNVAIQ